LPTNTHCALLLMLRNSLPVIEELAKQTVIFVHQCLSSDSYLIHFTYYDGMYVGRTFSLIGKNVFLCCSEFKLSIYDIPCLLYRIHIGIGTVELVLNLLR